MRKLRNKQAKKQRNKHTNKQRHKQRKEEATFSISIDMKTQTRKQTNQHTSKWTSKQASTQASKQTQHKTNTGSGTCTNRGSSASFSRDHRSMSCRVFGVFLWLLAWWVESLGGFRENAASRQVVTIEWLAWCCLFCFCVKRFTHTKTQKQQNMKNIEGVVTRHPLVRTVPSQSNWKANDVDSHSNWQTNKQTN